MGGIRARVTVEIPPARRVGRNLVVPGTGRVMLANGQCVPVLNVSPDHRAVVGDERLLRQRADGQMELETS
jgi:hypothetical protein